MQDTLSIQIQETVEICKHEDAEAYAPRQIPLLTPKSFVRHENVDCM